MKYMEMKQITLNGAFARFLIPRKWVSIVSGTVIRGTPNAP
jgi:hypothetical protein